MYHWNMFGKWKTVVLFLRGTCLYLKNFEVSTYFEGLLRALSKVIPLTIQYLLSCCSLSFSSVSCWMLFRPWSDTHWNSATLTCSRFRQQVFSLSSLRWFLAGATSGKSSCISNKHFSSFLTNAQLNFRRHKPLDVFSIYFLQRLWKMNLW